MNPVTILIADSYPILRVGVRTIFNDFPQFKVVGEASSNSEALELARSLCPNLVIMDLHSSDGSGIEACRSILEACPKTKVLFLSSYVDDHSILAAISAGAEAFVPKGTEARLLVEAACGAAVSLGLLPPSDGMPPSGTATTIDAPLAPSLLYSLLAPQERKILPLVVQGMTNKEVGRTLGLSHQTVRNYLSNIARKVKVSRRSELAALFAGCGCEMVN